MNPTETFNRQNNRQKVVVVLGPPRSGTSITGGLLHILGVDMGNLRGATPQNPTGARPQNPKGLFEDKDFLALIREIIIAADPELNKGDAVLGFNNPPVEKVSSQKANFDGRIKEFIDERAASVSCPVWGWKVITTNIAIELFLPHLTNPHFVVVFRNPLDIGKSFVDYTKGKQNLTITKALQICSYYYKSIFDFLDSHPDLPVLFVSFDDIVANPSKETGRMADFLNIEFNSDHADRANELVIPRNKIRTAKKRARFKQILRQKIHRIKRRIVK